MPSSRRLPVSARNTDVFAMKRITIRLHAVIEKRRKEYFDVKYC